jgi:CheY-like chemotaxis protein
MPEQDGLEVMMWLRLNKQSCHPKAIAISGGAASLDLNELLIMCRLLSADKVLPKPVDFETLSSAVREVLESGVEGYQKQA